MGGSLPAKARVAHGSSLLSGGPEVPHAPGTTEADNHYRALERLFTANDLIERHRLLRKHGLRLTSLPDRLVKSVNFITQAEVGIRVVSIEYGIDPVPEMDAAATAMRIARALAQRRGRGNECFRHGFADVANSLLHELGVPKSTITEWSGSLELLSAIDRPRWSVGQITTVASSLPLRVAIDTLIDQTRTLSHLRSVFHAGTGADWILHDLGLLLYREHPPTGHTAPISDLLYSADAASEDRVSNVLSVLDRFAATLDEQLRVNLQLPDVVREHFEPVRHLVSVIATGLDQRGLL